MATRPRARAPRVEPPTADQLRLEYVAVDCAIPYDRNPRKNEEAITAVMASIQQFGFRVPLILDGNYVIVSGHTRLEAAKRLGMRNVPSFIASDLTPEQTKAFRIADNKVAEQAEWDEILLANEIGELEGVGIDWTSFGFQSAELDDLSALLTSEADTPDRLAEAAAGPATPEPVPGYITPDALSVRVQIGEVIFHCGVPEYKAWLEGVRATNGYADDRIIADLADRLGMSNGLQDRKAVLRAAREARVAASVKPPVVTRSMAKPRVRVPPAAPQPVSPPTAPARPRAGTRRRGT